MDCNNILPLNFVSLKPPTLWPKLTTTQAVRVTTTGWFRSVRSAGSGGQTNKEGGSSTLWSRRGVWWRRLFGEKLVCLKFSLLCIPIEFAPIMNYFTLSEIRKCTRLQKRSKPRRLKKPLTSPAANQEFPVMPTTPDIRRLFCKTKTRRKLTKRRHPDDMLSVNNTLKEPVRLLLFVTTL